MIKNSLLLLASFSLLSCGGGGGGGSAPAPVPVAVTIPPISITFSSNLSEPLLGDEIQLNWSVSNASSCSATGSWSGSKALSGSETLKLKISGDITFGLTCSSSSSSDSKSLVIPVTPALNAYAYINGPTTFSGFLVTKSQGLEVLIKSVEVDLDVYDDNSLFITQLRWVEERNFNVQKTSDGSYDDQGYRLGINRNIQADGSSPTNIGPQVSEIFGLANQILLNSNDAINPFTYFDPDMIVNGMAQAKKTADDYEKFNADITLSFTGTTYPKIEMSTLAFPKGCETCYDASFIGSSNNNGSYSFLYIVDKREVEKYSNNLVQESDIFIGELDTLGLYTTFLSNPNFYEIAANIEVTSSQYSYYNANSQTTANLKNGRYTNKLLSNSYDTSGNLGAYVVKYLQPETSSNQRAYIKYTLSSGCKSEYGTDPSGNKVTHVCTLSEPEIYFFKPDKSALIGFELGGYFGATEETFVRFLLAPGTSLREL